MDSVKCLRSWWPKDVLGYPFQSKRKNPAFCLLYYEEGGTVPVGLLIFWLQLEFYPELIIV